MDHNRKIIYWAGFLHTVALALTYYINSSFLAGALGERWVGLIYAGASLASLAALLLTPALFRKIGGHKFLLFVSIFSSLSFLSLATFAHPAAIVASFILSFSLNTVLIFILDEFLKIFSETNTVGYIRGVYLTVLHVALILALLSFWLVLGSWPLSSIYFLSFLIMILFILTATPGLKKLIDPEYDKESVLKFLQSFFKRVELRRAYGLGFLVQLFYAWMIIYTPIYLSAHLGFSWNEIGIIFAVMLLPFLFIPTTLGRYGDRFGERQMLMWGFTVAAIATLFLFFSDSREVWAWAAILFLTRIGMASAEIMSDAYFFKHIRAENEEFIGVYRTAVPVAYILGPLLASLIFLLVPAFNFIYVILSALMLLGVYLASTVRKDDI